MKPLRAIPRAALLILAGYLLLALLYSAVAPIFESSDEMFHFPYVEYVAAGHGLPVQQPQADSTWQRMWRQEGSQPPLYYLLAAALVRGVDLSDLEQVRLENPHARVGVPLASDNKNLVIHSARERFPWRGVTLAVHLARLFSVLLGAGTVFCTYLLARSLAPGRPAVALGAMAANAFLPMFIYISASVNNDNLVIFLSSLTLLWLVRLVLARPTRLPAGRVLIPLGVLVGLAALSKLSGLALAALVCLALFQRRDTTSGARHWLPGWVRDCVIVLASAAAVAGWWYVRNLLLYGDPTGLSAMLQAAGRRMPAPTLRDLAGEFEGFRINFWGLFGAVNILLKPAWVYRLLDVLALAAGVGLALAALRVVRGIVRGAAPEARRRWRGWLLVTVWVGVVFVSLMRWTALTPASQGRLMFPTISALALLFVMGLTALVERAGRAWSGLSTSTLTAIGAAILPAVLLPLAVTAPFVSILPAYAPPPRIAAAALPASAQRVDVTYGDVLHLLAIEVGADAVRPGDPLDVTLYWEARKPAERNYSFFLQLVGRDGAILGSEDTYPGGGTLATTRLVGGEVVADRYRIVVDRPPTDGPVLARLDIGVYDKAADTRLPAQNTSGEMVGPTLAWIKVGGMPLDAAAAALQPLRAGFGGALLAGYRLSAPEVRPGETLTVTLRWDVTAALERDYTVFLHLRDASGQTVAQGDGPPAGGSYPTSLWVAGEQLLDAHAVRVADTVAPGRYTLVGGLYDPQTGQRLLLDGSGESEAPIATVEIGP